MIKIGKKLVPVILSVAMLTAIGGVTVSAAEYSSDASAAAVEETVISESAETEAESSDVSEESLAETESAESTNNEEAVASDEVTLYAETTDTELAVQTINVSESISLNVGETCTIYVYSSGDGAISFDAGGTSLFSLSSVKYDEDTGKYATVVTAAQAGTATITVSASETDTYSKATETINVSVGLATPTVSAISNASTGVKVTWSKVTGASGYYIYRSTSASGTYSKVGTVTSGSTKSYTDTGSVKSISSGKTYYYKVSAYYTSDAGTVTSAKSSYQSLLYLKRVVISGFTETADGIKIKYSKVTGASGYYIYRSTSKSGNYSQIDTVKSGSTVTYTDTDAATNGKTYYYKVKAYSGSTTSANSAVKSVKYLKEETVSSISKTSSGYAKLTWKKNSKATGYYIYRKVSGGDYEKVKTIKSSDTTSWTDKSISKNKKYTYYAKAYYGSSVSAKANTISIMVPSKPSISSLSAGTGSITVKWKKNSSVTGYQIQYATNSSFTSGKKTVTVTGASKVSKTVTGLSSSKKYYVRVRSYKTVGGKKFYSAWSTTKSKTTKAKVTVFAGDSISTGLSGSYNGISKIKIGGSKHVVAYTGINTQTFQTKTVFGGKTGVAKVTSYNPTRVYIMLGMNEINWRTPSAVVSNYEEITMKH